MGVTAHPSLLVTGSSGFLGRHLLEELKEEHRIFGLARRSQAQSGAPMHRNITWLQVDIRDRERVLDAFNEIGEAGGVDIVVHLAAHYDFTGENHPDYWRTNVEGLRNVLDGCRSLDLQRFIFASSAAACGFPSTGDVVTESSIADGRHTYALTKRIGEEMVSLYEDSFPSTIVRFAALFSDWCEFPPLFISLKTWLSKSWKRKVLGGSGLFGIPYLHVMDAVAVVLKAISRAEDLEPGRTVLASPNGAVTTRDLYEEATRYYYGTTRDYTYLPKYLCRAGMFFADRMGLFLGERPFERPWMARYLDRRLVVDSSRSQQLLDWIPRERLNLLRRLPFLIENLKTDPIEWSRRNHAAMRIVRPADNLRIHQLLEKHERRIYEEVTDRMVSAEGQRRFRSYQLLPAEEREWNHRVALRHLMDSVRTLDKSKYRAFCRDLAELRYTQGFSVEEVCEAMRTLRTTCLSVIREDPVASGLDEELQNHVTMTMLFGCDQIEDTYERLREAQQRRRSRRRPRSSRIAKEQDPLKPPGVNSGRVVH